MALKALLFASLLTLTSLLADTSSTDAEFRGEAKAKITFLEKQNTELKTKLDSLEDKQKNVEEYKNIIDRQDKRIDDVNAKMAWAAEKSSSLANIIGLWAIIATFISIAIPVYFTFKWKIEAEEKSKELDQLVIKGKEELIKLAQEHDEFLNQKDLMKGKDIKEYSETDGDQAGLNGAFQYALYKAQTYPDFKTWFDVAMLALKLKDEKATDYWDNTINVATNDLSRSIAIINKGATFGMFKKYNKVIETYDYFLEKFGHTKNEKIQVYIANALVGKGIAQEQFLQSKQKAIETYNYALEKFGHSKNEKINIPISQALLHKGMLQVEVLESIPKATETYIELIEKFGDSKNNKIIQQIISALLNLFELQLIENKPFDAKMIQKLKDYANENKQPFIKYKMMEIVRNARTKDQSLMIDQLKKEFPNVSFGDWSWKELDRWSEKLEDVEVKVRIKKTIEAFKNW